MPRDMMIGPGGVAKYPRSESREIARAMTAIQNGDTSRALAILKRLHEQVEEGYHANPSSSRMYEPFKIIGVIGTDVHHIAYKHVNDGKLYKHDFQRGSAEVIAVERHGKRELLVTSPDGVPLWEEF